MIYGVNTSTTTSKANFLNTYKFISSIHCERLKVTTEVQQTLTSYRVVRQWASFFYPSLLSFALTDISMNRQTNIQS